MSAVHDVVASWAAPFTIHVVVSSAVLIVALAASFAPRLTARTRFAVVAIGIGKFLLPSVIFMRLVRQFASPATPVPTMTIPRGIAAALPREVASSFTVVDAVALLWIAVALLLVVRTLITGHRLVTTSLRNSAPPSRREFAALTVARNRIGVRQGIDLVRSPLCEAPAVLRVFRPIIVLPGEGADHLADDELESLLSHECAHVARRDNLIAIVEMLVRAFFWFNPLMWVAHRRLALEREKACDEAASDTTERADAYAVALAKICHAMVTRPLAGVACMASTNLQGRMEHIMSYHSLKRVAVPHVLAILAAASTIVAATVATAMSEDGGKKRDNQPYPVAGTIASSEAGQSAVVAGAEGSTISKQSRDRIEHDRPETVVIKTLEGDDSAITIRGESANVNAIATFVENIDEDPRFTAPEVSFVREKPNSSPRLYEYELRFAVSSTTHNSN